MQLKEDIYKDIPERTKENRKRIRKEKNPCSSLLKIKKLRLHLLLLHRRKPNKVTGLQS